MNMDEHIIVSSIIDKLPPSWKDFKDSLKHKKEDLSLEELANSLRIEEEFRKQENTKLLSSVNLVEDGHCKKKKFDKKIDYKKRSLFVGIMEVPVN